MHVSIGDPAARSPADRSEERNENINKICKINNPDFIQIKHQIAKHAKSFVTADIETRKDSNRANGRKRRRERERVIKKQKLRRENKNARKNSTTAWPAAKHLFREPVSAAAQNEKEHERAEKKMLRQYIVEYNEWNVFRLILGRREIQTIKAIYSVWIREANAAEPEETEEQSK